MGGIEVVDPGYRALLARARSVLSADNRVSAIEVGGSIASGDADQWSDLDLRVVARPESHEEFLADWRDWLAAITPTVFARTPIAPFIINAVTADGLTLDIAVYNGQIIEFPPPAGYAAGMLSSQRFPTAGEALDYAVLEQLRGLAGPFITLVARDEHLKHLSGVPHLLGLLTSVFLAELDTAPPGKRWNETFTEEQLHAAASLPPVSATRDGVVAFGLAVAELVVRRGRALYPRYGLEWPAPLAEVAAGRLRDLLGIDTSGWLT